VLVKIHNYCCKWKPTVAIGTQHLWHNDCCVPAAGTDTWRQLRSSNCQLLAVPRYRLNTYGCRAFLVADPTVWNFLLDFIRDLTVSADCFRRLLKIYIFCSILVHSAR